MKVETVFDVNGQPMLVQYENVGKCIGYIAYNYNKQNMYIKTYTLGTPSVNKDLPQNWDMI